jgi:DNA-binding XRE family transcriptional regulator
MKLNKKIIEIFKDKDFIIELNNGDKIDVTIEDIFIYERETLIKVFIK